MKGYAISVSNHHSSKSYKLRHFIVLFSYFHNVVVIILGFDLLSKLVYCGVEIEWIIPVYYIMACIIEVIGPKERVRVFRCEFCMCIKEKWAYLWSCKFVQNKVTNYCESIILSQLQFRYESLAILWLLFLSSFIKLLSFFLLGKTPINFKIWQQQNQWSLAMHSGRA